MLQKSNIVIYHLKWKTKIFICALIYICFILQFEYILRRHISKNLIETKLKSVLCRLESGHNRVM